MTSRIFRYFVRHYAREIVRAVYAAILNREPDAVGLATYTAALQAHGNLGNVIQAIADSPEAWGRALARRAEDVVTAVYGALLCRRPDANGLRYYAARVTSIQGLEQLMSAIIRSEEFQERATVDPGVRASRRTLARASTGGLAPEFAASDLLAEKLVFLHIPKTGGTTLHDFLVKQFRAADVCPERFNGLRYYQAGELARYKFFSGHFDLPSIRLIAGKKRIITFLREPVERLISLYYFQRAHRPDVVEANGLHLARLANRHSIAEFFGNNEVRAHPAINNAMTRVLTETIEGSRWEADAPAIDSKDAGNALLLAMKELEALDAFGVLERYEESVRLICRRIGLTPPATIERKQVTDLIMNAEPGLRPIEKEEITDKTRNLIRELVVADLKLYEYACELFARRVAASENMRRGTDHVAQ